MLGAGSRPALVSLLALALVSAGCVGMEDAAEQLEETTTDENQAAPATQGNMTANESEQTHEGIREGAPPFYASRVVTIEGLLTLDQLPIDLSTVNGPIEVRPGAEGAYTLVANLTGYGFTPMQAEENRDELRLDWGIGTPANRHLFAHVEHEDDDDEPVDTDGFQSKGKLSLEVPPSLIVDLTTDSTNGDVLVEGLTASSLQAATTNGGLTVEGVDAETLTVESTNGHVEVRDTSAGILTGVTTNGPLTVDVDGTQQVALESTNGAVDATVRPAESGQIEVGTTNDQATLRLPEDSAHGYLLQAQTTNGDIDIQLEDGSTQRQGGEYTGGQATFETNGFNARDIRTQVTMRSTNGDLVAKPA